MAASGAHRWRSDPASALDLICDDCGLRYRLTPHIGCRVETHAHRLERSWADPAVMRCVVEGCCYSEETRREMGLNAPRQLQDWLELIVAQRQRALDEDMMRRVGLGWGWGLFWGEVAAACVLACDGGFFLCHACPDDPEPHVHQWSGVRWIESDVLHAPARESRCASCGSKLDGGWAGTPGARCGRCPPAGMAHCPATPPHDGCVLCRGSGVVEAL